MSKMPKTSKAHKQALNTQTNHPRWFITRLAISAAWMAVGYLLTLIQVSSVQAFVWDWIIYGGPALILLGTWLLLMIKTESFRSFIVTCERPLNPALSKLAGSGF